MLVCWQAIKNSYRDSPIRGVKGKGVEEKICLYKTLNLSEWKENRERNKYIWLVI